MQTAKEITSKFVYVLHSNSHRFPATCGELQQQYALQLCVSTMSRAFKLRGGQANVLTMPFSLCSWCVQFEGNSFLSVWKTTRPINLYKREHVFLHVLFTNFNCVVWDKIHIPIKDNKNVVKNCPNIELPYLAFSGGLT
jgi:hypothetical protein